MDSQERHELKQNDLQEFLENFNEWWGKHGNTVLIIVAVVVIVFAGRHIYQTRTAQVHDESWAELTGAISPVSLDDVAERYARTPAIRDQAYLRAGDAYFLEAMPDATEEKTQEHREAALEAAADRYQRVLDKSTEPVFQVNALEGLANVAETREQWDQAADYWQQIITLAERHHLHAFVHRAESRLSMIDTIREPIVFGQPRTPTLPPAGPGRFDDDFGIPGGLLDGEDDGELLDLLLQQDDMFGPRQQQPQEDEPSIQDPLQDPFAPVPVDPTDPDDPIVPTVPE